MGSCKSKSAKVNPINRPIVTMICGIDNAGKTTLKTVLNDQLDAFVVPTVGFSKPLNQVIDDFNTTIYDLGGGATFRKAWKDFFPGVHGLIFVVDASDTSRMDEVKETLHDLANTDFVKGKPILILANKQDLPSAVDEVVIAEKLGLTDLNSSNKVCTCIAKNSETQDKNIDPRINVAFKWLIATIASNYDEINQKVEKDTEEQEAQKKIDIEERNNRVEALKKEREEAAKSGGKVEKIAPNAVGSGSDAPKCTLCQVNPAELKHSVANWKPVCQSCVDGKMKEEIPKCVNCESPAVMKSAKFNWKPCCAECDAAAA